MTKYGDLLSAESLLFAVLGVVFGVWYPEIVEATKVKIPDHIQDVTTGDRDMVSEALWHKSVPLAGAVVVIFLVFVPESVRIVVNSISHASDFGLRALSHYDAIQAALVVVTVLEGLFAFVVIALTCKLRGVQSQQKG